MTAVSARLGLPIALATALGVAACHSGSDGSAAGPTPTPARAVTPVETATVELADLARTISAPGHTEALVKQEVRAPFPGTLTALSVVVGDAVAKGQQVGTLVARDAEAALRGAEAMLRNAQTPAERADAERALELARANLVTTPLRSSVSGLVVERTAATGDRVAENQGLLMVAARGSLVFVAELGQGELDLVKPGQPVEIALSGQSSPLAGTVHGILAAASPGDLTVPIRIDPATPGKIGTVGLFGTATITVAHRRHVPAVPAAAVLTNDVSGTKRLALVRDGKAHWIDVQTGLASGGLVEITTPKIAPGTEVVVGGQVGLPEGTPVTGGS